MDVSIYAPSASAPASRQQSIRQRDIPGGFRKMLLSLQPSKPIQEPSELPGADLSPAEMYERMTMAAAPPERTSKTINGTTWTDDLLALFASYRSSRMIDTTKTINWESTGDQELTDEQAAQLKLKYDLERLSPQEYYDLMSDLTHMNVLKAEDIAAMHVKRIIAGHFPDNAGPSIGFRTSGSLLEDIVSEQNSLKSLYDFMLSELFWKMNPQKDRKEYQSDLSSLQERMQSMERLNRVFSKLS